MKDSEFIRDSKVPMTKEEVRAVSLSYLDIHNKKNFLDIGAGSGSCFLEVLVTNKNLKTEAVQFNLNLERGCKYSAAMYLYSPEDRKSYYKGEVGEEILSIPLTLYEGSENVKAYVICYKEN